MKKALSLSLALIMVFALFCIPAFAATTVASGTFGADRDNLTWTLDDEGTLTVSGKGAMGDSIPWSSQRDGIKTVVIGDGVTEIGWNAFEDCSNLTSITIPDSVTHIRYCAFYNCSSLTSITIPDSVTSIGNGAFYGCSGLADDDGFIVVYGVLYGYCGDETSITIPDSVTSIGYDAFYGCSSLTSITIPDSVTSIGGYAFVACSSLTSITIPDSVTSIGGNAFSDCSSLTSITIPDSVTSIDNWAFSNCSSLTSITIPDSVTSIGYYAFNGCSNLTSITIPDSVTEIGGNAFRGCRNLTSITIPDSVTSIGDAAFSGCDGLADEDGFVIVWGVLYDYLGDETSVTIPDGVTEIGDSAFSYCGSLTSITIPDGVTSIGDEAFRYCRSLTSITIPDSVTSIGIGAFRGCSGLADDDGFIVFQGVLYEYIGDETSITIPEGVMSIGDYAFAERYSLTSITIPDSVTEIGDSAFSYCGSLTSITIPDSVTSIGNSAFEGCENLTSITLPEGVTEIGDYAFIGCSSLTSISIPDSVTSIGDAAFFGCYGLADEDGFIVVRSVLYGYTGDETSVTIPDGVTSIGYGAFAECESLTSITIPSSVTSIGGEAFDYCQDLTDVYFGGSQAEWKAIEIGEYNEPLTSATIHFASSSGAVLEDTTRVFGSTRYDTAFDTADTIKELRGIEKFDCIVVASGEDFADALSGSYLANRKGAPMLLVKNRNSEINEVKDYIKANLNPGGTVYLLGGEKAVPKAMETGLDGFNVKRLAGATRYDTNLAILREAGITGEDILVCTGKNFADGLSASAVNKPVLLVKDSLTSAQKELLSTANGGKIYVIGGTNAVNAKIESALTAYGSVSRLSGADRYQTSVAIAKTFFGGADSAVLVYGLNFPDGLSGGSLAYSLNAPLILTANGKQSIAKGYTSANGITSGAVLGGSGLISDKVVKEIFSMSSGDQIIVK